MSRARARASIVISDHEIEAISTRLAERLGGPTRTSRPAFASRRPFPRAPSARSCRDGARICDPDRRARSSSCLPGPPPELRRLWRGRASRTTPSVACSRARRPPERRIAAVLRRQRVRRRAGARGGRRRRDGVEATVCARDFEIHVDLVVGEAGGARRMRSPPPCAGAWARVSLHRRRANGRGDRARALPQARA